MFCATRAMLGGPDAEAVCVAGAVVVGRAVADRGAGSARGLARDRCAARRSSVDGADRGALGARGRGAWALVSAGRASNDRDADLCAADGPQAALALRLRDAAARGVRLDSPTLLLLDRAARARAVRVDGPQDDTPPRSPDGHRAVSRGDRRCGARATLSRSRGTDRLDRRRGRRALPDRRGSGGGRDQGAGARGWQATRPGCRWAA